MKERGVNRDGELIAKKQMAALTAMQARELKTLEGNG